MLAVLHQCDHGHSHGGRSHGHGGRGKRKGRRDKEGEEGKDQRENLPQHKNINVHAAFIHVLGDLIQSIGIVVAGYIVWFKVSVGS